MSDINEKLLKQILENQVESRDAISSLDKKLDLHIQETRFGFETIHKLDETQNRILEEHSARSDRLEKDNALREEQLRLEFGQTTEKIDKRVSRLEAPVKWLKTSSKLLLWLGGAAGALYAMYELFDRISK